MTGYDFFTLFFINTCGRTHERSATLLLTDLFDVLTIENITPIFMGIQVGYYER